MLSELELEVVRDCKIPCAGNTFQVILACLGEFEGCVAGGSFPVKDGVEEAFRWFSHLRIAFDFKYLKFGTLQDMPVNPLKSEQECWGLLSPRVVGYLRDWRAYLECYPPEYNDQTRQDFLARLQMGQQLFGMWQPISKSYNAKFDNESEQVIAERELAVRQLVQELSSGQQVSP